MATEITESNFDALVLQSSIPVLVDFSATWCGPCRVMEPVIDEMAGKYSGKCSVFKIDADESRDTLSKYGVNVLPTFILFKNGAPAEKIIGACPKSKIEGAVEYHL